MEHPKFIASNQKEESICILRVKQSILTKRVYKYKICRLLGNGDLLNLFIKLNACFDILSFRSNFTCCFILNKVYRKDIFLYSMGMLHAVCHRSL